MVQFILTILIIIIAGAIAMVRFIRFFMNPPDTCSSCQQNCGRCSLEELIRERNNSRPDYIPHDK